MKRRISLLAASISVSGSATRTTPADRAVAQKGHGRVDQRPVEGPAHVLAVALAGRQSLLHLGARGVVVHARHVAERDLRVSEHDAVGPDDRHPRARGPPELVGERVPGGEVVRERRGEPRASRATRRARSRRLVCMVAVRRLAMAGVR